MSRQVLIDKAFKSDSQRLAFLFCVGFFTIQWFRFDGGVAHNLMRLSELPQCPLLADNRQNAKGPAMSHRPFFVNSGAPGSVLPSFIIF